MLIALKINLKRILSMPGKLYRLARRLTGVDEVRIVYAVLKGKSGCNTMIDVGAHYGGSLEKFFADGWKVFAFEPDPRNRQVLNNKFGAEDKVIIDDRALSNEERSNAPFYSSDISTGISGLSDFHESHTQSTVVTITTLENIICDNEIKSVEFLKIDTEGYDLFVLMGNNWDELKPDVIVAEFENSKTEPLGYRYTDLVQFLKQKGYSILVSEWYPIVKYGDQHRWRNIGVHPYNLENENGWGNIIASKDKDTFERICKAARQAGIIYKITRFFLNNNVSS